MKDKVIQFIDPETRQVKYRCPVEKCSRTYTIKTDAEECLLSHSDTNYILKEE